MVRALLLASAVALLAAPSAEGAKASKCQRLKGKDLARARSVKLVIRDNAQGGEDLVGCRLPDGKARVLARTDFDGFYYPSLSIEKIAGSWVLIEITYFGPDEGTSFENVVVDAATGRRYGVAGSRPCRMPAPQCTFDPPLRVSINRRGRAVALERRFDLRVVVGYNARGQASVLDEGPAAALPSSDVRLKGDLANWTHSGASLSAAVGERSCNLAGTDLAPAKDVVLVDRVVGKSGGEPVREVVGCVKPAGPRRVVVMGPESSFGLGEVVGSWVLVGQGASYQSGSSGSTDLVDLRSGRRYTVYSYTCMGSCDGGPPILLFNNRGQAATAFEAQGQTAVTAFTSTGARQSLDRGPSAELPASSLRLTGSTASWTRNGEVRTFEIPAG